MQSISSKHLSHLIINFLVRPLARAQKYERLVPVAQMGVSSSVPASCCCLHPSHDQATAEQTPQGQTYNPPTLISPPTPTANQSSLMLPEQDPNEKPYPEPVPIDQIENQDLKQTQVVTDTSATPALNGGRKGPSSEVVSQRSSRSAEAIGSFVAYPDLEAKVSKPKITKTIQSEELKSQNIFQDGKVKELKNKASDEYLVRKLSRTRSESSSSLGADEFGWEPNEASQVCRICKASFGILNRRHHCRKW